MPNSNTFQKTVDIIKMGSKLRPVTAALSFIFIIVFSVQMVFLSQSGFESWKGIFILSLENFSIFSMLLSFVSHGSPIHLIVNTVVFLSFSKVEERIPSTIYLATFLGGSIIGGVAQLGIASYFGTTINLLGASAGIFAIIGLYALYYPNKKIYILFFIPANIQAAVGAIVVGTIAVVSVGGVAFGSIGHTAHLGGLLSGVGIGYFARKYWLPEYADESCPACNSENMLESSGDTFICRQCGHKLSEYRADAYRRSKRMK